MWNFVCILSPEEAFLEVSIYFENPKTIPPVTAKQLDSEATNQMRITTSKLAF
jgi:hypothetical protein